MDLVFVIIAVLVVFVVVAAAADRVSVLDADESQLPGPSLPSGHLEPSDLDAMRFAVVPRGYRMDHVDEVIDRLGLELRNRDERIAALEAGAQQPLPRRTPTTE